MIKHLKALLALPAGFVLAIGFASNLAAADAAHSHDAAEPPVNLAHADEEQHADDEHHEDESHHADEEHEADEHAHGAAEQRENLERMKELHRGHRHSHDFEAMEQLSAEDTQRLLGLMSDIGLALPPMNSHHGRELFVSKGCVVCHSVHNVGGDIGPPLNAADMPQPMNAFEFSARMWRGAPAMVQLQEDMLGDAISLSGQDLADLVAFAHDAKEQEELTEDQIPERFRKLIDQ